uniref:Peptidase M24 domain-containing protein n=1 Tax=Aegilops tauschii subsp. strangulata TaxID=200361 RepID=A0A453BEW4_AEGTS
ALLDMELELCCILSHLSSIMANENSGRMVEGQTFTIEPILIMDKAECVTWENGWTTVTDDGSWAAQFEHTVLVTRTGVEILTKH